MKNTGDASFDYQSFADELDKQDQIEKQPEGNDKASTIPKPASKMELQMLLEDRDKPVLQHEYAIGGTTEQYVHARAHEARESRIRYIARTFDKLRNKARDDFNMTQQRADMRKIERDR
jgi:hypothetical protein